MAAFSGQREYEAFLTKGSAPCYKVAIDLFLVNKQISCEALSVMYARNMFVFALLDTFVRFRNMIGPTNAASLRHVAILDLGRISKTAHQSLTEDKWFQMPDNPDARTNAFAGLSNLTDLELWWKPSAHTVDPNLAAHCICFCVRGFLDAVTEKEGDPFAAIEQITVPWMSCPPYSNKQYLEEMRSKMRWLMTNAPKTKYLQSNPELRDLEYELQAWKAMKLEMASRVL